MKKRRVRINPFIMGMVGFLFLLLGFVVFSTRVFAGIGPVIYEVPPRRTRSSIVINFCNEVYALEIAPSFIGFLLTTFGFTKGALKNIDVVLRFPKPRVSVHDSGNFRLLISMLLSSWSLFYLWFKTFLL